MVDFRLKWFFEGSIFNSPKFAQKTFNLKIPSDFFSGVYLKPLKRRFFFCGDRVFHKAISFPRSSGQFTSNIFSELLLILEDYLGRKSSFTNKNAFTRDLYFSYIVGERRINQWARKLTLISNWRYRLATSGVTRFSITSTGTKISQLNAGQLIWWASPSLIFKVR